MWDVWHRGANFCLKRIWQRSLRKVVFFLLVWRSITGWIYLVDLDVFPAYREAPAYQIDNFSPHGHLSICVCMVCVPHRFFIGFPQTMPMLKRGLFGSKKHVGKRENFAWAELLANRTGSSFTCKKLHLSLFIRILAWCVSEYRFQMYIIMTSILFIKRVPM